MRKRLLIAALAVILLITLGQSATAKTKRHHLLSITSPTPKETCLRDTVEIVVELENGADPSTFQAWLNSKKIPFDRFTQDGNTLKAVLGPGDGVRSYSEIIETTRDDKGVWFIEGRKNKFRNTKARYNLLKTKVRGPQKRADVATCVFEVNSSQYNTFEAMGYAIATDRLWQIELYRRTARGRLAEIFGSDQLASDKMMRTMGYSDDELTDGFAALDAESRAVIAGYVAGINRRIDEIRDDTTLLPFEFAYLVGKGLPLNDVLPDWTVEDTLAWCALLQRNFDPEALDQGQLENAALLEHLTSFAMQRLGIGDPEAFDVQQMAMGMFQDLRWPNDPEAQTYIVDVAAGTDEAGDMDGALRNVPGLKDACDKIKERRDKVRDNLKKINAKVKMGSYAWVVSGQKTASGNPIIYSGPQMGFSVPSIVCEGSIRAAGLDISGMTVPGIPGIIIGRSPHHAWSMQVGHAHTTDYFIEDPASVALHRVETIKVLGAADEILPVFRTANGPVVNAEPFISWRYAHWGHEFDVVKAFLGLAKAQSMDQFGAAIEMVAVSQHFCYADRYGNIAYWMSGRDPVRPMNTYLGPYLYFLPQGAFGEGLIQDWDDNVLVPRSHARNPERGFFDGWNNKTSPTYFNAFNSNNDIYGPFQRAHVIEEYLAPRNDLTFEDIRDLALNIATTDSFNGGGNPWAFVAEAFLQYVRDAGLDAVYPDALQTLDDWDGHFVGGGPDAWSSGDLRPQGWVLMNDWLREVIRLTFQDELGDDKGGYRGSNNTLLFNVILHAMEGKDNYDWFDNPDDDMPDNLPDIVTTALENVMQAYESEGYGPDMVPEDVERGQIVYTHAMLGPVWSTPLSNRSTYAHVVEFGRKGPVRIESMFPLGESGDITVGEGGEPVFDEHFFTMTPIYDPFAPRDFPLFTKMKHGKKR